MKPTRSLLAVRSPVDPAAAEAFLSGQPFPPSRIASASPAPAPTQASASAPASVPQSHPTAALGGRRVHERKDGRRVRRTTILMTEELARRLDLFAAARGVDKTTVHEAALVAWLAANGG